MTGKRVFRGIAAAVLLAAAQALLPSCSHEKEAAVAARCYDFLADIGNARITARGAPVEAVGLDDPLPPWTADERLFYPARPLGTIAFRNVPLGKRAVLHVGTGLSPDSFKPKDLDPHGFVRYRVEIATGGVRREIWSRTIEPALLEPGAVLEEEIPLPGLDARYGDFFFSSDCSAGMEPVQPVWCGLVLRSAGRPAEPDERSVILRERSSSLLDAPPSPKTPWQGVSFRAACGEETKRFRKAPSGRILLQKAPARASFELSIPPRASLSFGIAAAAEDGGRGPVLFRVLHGGEEVFSRTLEAGRKGFSRRIAVPLAFEKGRESTILLSTGLPAAGTGKERKAVGLWIDPVITTQRRVPRQGRRRGKNVLLLVVDALRADHLSCMGYSRKTSPNLDRAAGGGILFTDCRSQSSWTVPATATILTGRYSYTHGLYDVNHWFLVPGLDTIAGAFQEAGLSTTAFVANHLVARNNNFASGFESFHRLPFITAARLNRAFLNWLDEHGDERFFAYLHYMEPHMPYAAPGSALDRFVKKTAVPEGSRKVPPDPGRSDRLMRHLEAHLKQEEARLSPKDLSREDSGYLEELVGLYDSEIAYFDERFALLLAELESRGLLENTIVVVTADHGEEFMEHGLLKHGQSLHGELLHVPLVILNSGLPPERRGETVGLVDLAPTLLALAGVPPGKSGPPFAGRDLFRDRRTGGKRVLFAETAHGRRSARSGMIVERAVLSGEWKGILFCDDGTLRLYDRRNDAAECNDLAPSRPAEAEAMKKLIGEWVRECRARAPLDISLFDASALEELKAMGYLK